MATEITPQAGRILDRALVLLAAGGYNAFSYADISAQVGITKASIHHHFQTKSDLVRVVIQRYTAAAVEGTRAMTANVANPMDRLRACAAWWSACIHDGSMPICVCAMLAAELPVLPEEVAVEVRLHFAWLTAWLERVMADGEAGGFLRLDSTPAAEAQAFMAVVHGAMLSARTCNEPALFERVVRGSLDRLELPIPVMH